VTRPSNTVLIVGESPSWPRRSLPREKGDDVDKLYKDTSINRESYLTIQVATLPILE